MSVTEAARSGLDVMLMDAAEGGPPRFLAPGAGVKVGARLAVRPRRAGGRLAALAGELGRTAVGRSELATGARRPALRRPRLAGQLAPAPRAAELPGGRRGGRRADLRRGADWRTERQARLAAGNLVDALAPTNFPWSNPAVLKEIVDSGGVNLVRGRAAARARPLRRRGCPRRSTRASSRSAATSRVTPGSVVLRTEVFELIQYKPATAQVREVPLLIVPPTINKFYILDLAPGRSIVEHLVAQGQQVFVISWRNPDAEQGHFDLDTYARGGARGARRGGRDHRAATPSTCAPRARAGSSPPACSATSPPRAGSARSRA